jgi:hypothetical protein
MNHNIMYYGDPSDNEERTKREKEALMSFAPRVISLIAIVVLLKSISNFHNIYVSVRT